MAIHISDYPKEDSKVTVGKWDEIQKALPKFRFGAGNGYVIMDGEYSGIESYANIHEALKIVVFRKGALEETKAEIKNALEPRGFEIASKEYTPSDNLDSIAWDARFRSGWWRANSIYVDNALKGLFSLDHIYVEALRKKQGIINNRTSEFLNLIVPFNPDILSYSFAVYSPDRLSAGSTDDEESSEGDFTILYHKPFEVLKVPNNGGVDIEILEDKLLKLNPTPAVAVGLASKVIMNDGREMHIPMIDFSTDCDENDANRIVRELNITPSILVSSGNSFHAYGTALQTPKQWSDFLSMLSNYESIGKLWPKFQEIKGFSLLRVTACDKKPYFPEISDYFSE